MPCTNSYFNGWGECAAMMEKTKGGALQGKGETWTDATAITAVSWRTVIADDDSAVRNTLMLPVFNFENTTDDVEITTSPLGKSEISGKPIPKGIIYLDASLCDYKHLHDLEDTWFEYVPFFSDGSFWMTRKADGTLKGFRCKIGTKAGLPPEDKTQSYPVYIFFNDVEEFEDVVVLTPDFKFQDLMDYSPVGLEIKVTTAMSSGMVVLQVDKRGSGDPMTGLDQVGDFEVMKSNGTPIVAATVVTENGQGSYDVTFKTDSGGTPANPSATEYIIIQAHDDDTTYLTYLSHSLKFFGA